MGDPISGAISAISGVASLASSAFGGSGGGGGGGGAGQLIGGGAMKAPDPVTLPNPSTSGGGMTGNVLSSVGGGTGPMVPTLPMGGGNSLTATGASASPLTQGDMMMPPSANPTTPSSAGGTNPNPLANIASMIPPMGAAGQAYMRYLQEKKLQRQPGQVVSPQQASFAPAGGSSGGAMSPSLGILPFALPQLPQLG